MEKAGQEDPTRGLLQTKAKKQGQAQLEELYSQIGRLKVENEWLRKTSVRTLEEKRQMIGWEHPQLTVQRQCELLELARSSLYYRPVGEPEYNLELMRIIDRVYTDRPILGVRRMTAMRHRMGHAVNHKRIYRLMRLMQIQAIYPKRQRKRSRTPAQVPESAESIQDRRS